MLAHRMTLDLWSGMIWKPALSTAQFRRRAPALPNLILGLQSRDKAAMLVVKTKEFFWQNLYQNRIHFPAERNAFVFDPQHGRRDVTCKPAIAIRFDCSTAEARL